MDTLLHVKHHLGARIVVVKTTVKHPYPYIAYNLV